MYEFCFALIRSLIKQNNKIIEYKSFDPIWYLSRCLKVFKFGGWLPVGKLLRIVLFPLSYDYFCIFSILLCLKSKKQSDRSLYCNFFPSKIYLSSIKFKMFYQCVQYMFSVSKIVFSAIGAKNYSTIWKLCNLLAIRNSSW